MRRPRLSRHVISLLAAYLVALQALLLPLTVATGAPLGTSLCLSTDHAATPGGGQSGCPCSAGCGMQCCTPMLGAPPTVTLARADARGGTVLSVPAFVAVLPSPRWQPHSARAPPSA